MTSSHGCIRVEDPARLAEWILRDPHGWSPERIGDAMEGTATFRVPLPQPISVAVYYTTVVAMPDGTGWFYPDIYGRDEELGELLRNGRPLPPTIAEAPPPR